VLDNAATSSTSQTLFGWVSPRAITLDSSNVVAHCITPGSVGNSKLDISIDGSSVGVIDFASAETTGVYTDTSMTSIATGSYIVLTTDGTDWDTAISGIRIVIPGTTVLV